MRLLIRALRFSVVIGWSFCVLIPEKESFGAFTEQPARITDTFPFRETGDFAMERDGRIDLKSRVYADLARTQFLIITNTSQYALWIDTANAQGRELNSSQLDFHEIDEFARVVPEGALARKAAGRNFSCRLAENRLDCDVNGHTDSVVARPILLGEVTVEQVYAHGDTYLRAHGSYRPNAKEIGRLHEGQEEIEIRLYFGSWNLYAMRFVPQFLKVISEANNSKIRYRLIAVDRRLNGPTVDMGLYALPTFVILRRGREVGRFVGRKLPIELELRIALGLPSH